MSDIATSGAGVFVSGQKNVGHAELNSIIGNAVIQPAFHTGKNSIAANPSKSATEIMVYDSGAATFKKGTLAALIFDNSEMLSGRTAKTVPVAADAVLLADSAASGAVKQMTLANLLFGAAAYGASPVAADKLVFYDSVNSAVKTATLAYLLGSTTDLSSVDGDERLLLLTGAGSLRSSKVENLIANASAVAANAIVGTESLLLFQGTGVKRSTLAGIVSNAASTVSAPSAGDLVTYVGLFDSAAVNRMYLGSLLAAAHNVVQGTKSDTAALTPTTVWTDVPSLTVTITPRSSSSKVLITVSLSAVAGTNPAMMRVLRDAVEIGSGASDGANRTECAAPIADNGGVTDRLHTITWSWLDSPAATVGTVYKVQVNQVSGTVYVNRTSADTNAAGHARAVSTIIAREVYIL